jgi:hypothetical protein
MQERRSVFIAGLPKRMHRSFIRALAISGAGTQSSWLQNQIKRFIEEKRKQFGKDLLHVLTEEEKAILDSIASGCNEIDAIVEESLTSERHVRKILSMLVDGGYVRKTKRGAKTDMARGAVIDMYVLTDEARKQFPEYE